MAAKPSLCSDLIDLFGYVMARRRYLMMSDLPESTTTHFTPARPKLWRWILGTLIILFSCLVIGGILYSIVASVFDLDLQILDGADEADREILRSYQPWQIGRAHV